MTKSDQSLPPEQAVTFSTPADSKFVERIISNVKSEVIEITADKLENILLKHLTKLGSRKAWIAPLSLFITCLVASLTATFSKKLGIDGPVWQALFILGAIASGVWGIVAVVKMLWCWHTCSLEHLISIVKRVRTGSQPGDATDGPEPH